MKSLQFLAQGFDNWILASFSSPLSLPPSLFHVICPIIGARCVIEFPSRGQTAKEEGDGIKLVNSRLIETWQVRIWSRYSRQDAKTRPWTELFYLHPRCALPPPPPPPPNNFIYKPRSRGLEAPSISSISYPAAKLEGQFRSNSTDSFFLEL